VAQAQVQEVAQALERETTELLTGQPVVAQARQMTVETGQVQEEVMDLGQMAPELALALALTLKIQDQDQIQAEAQMEALAMVLELVMGQETETEMADPEEVTQETVLEMTQDLAQVRAPAVTAPETTAMVLTGTTMVFPTTQQTSALVRVTQAALAMEETASPTLVMEMGTVRQMMDSSRRPSGQTAAATRRSSTESS